MLFIFFMKKKGATKGMYSILPLLSSASSIFLFEAIFAICDSWQKVPLSFAYLFTLYFMIHKPFSSGPLWKFRIENRPGVF